MLWMHNGYRLRVLEYCIKLTLLNMLLFVKRCWAQTSLTVSAGMCPPLCLRGGLGRTRVTWWRGRPCVGSSDRPSQDAERDSGEEYDGTEGGGEELESSHKPDSGEERWKDYRGCETEKVQSQRQDAGITESHHFCLKVVEFITIGENSEIYWLRLGSGQIKTAINRLLRCRDGKGKKRVNRKHTNGALKETGWGQS